MRRLPLIVLCLAIAFPAHAASTVSREEGFARIWQTIRRPAFDTREVPFTDVPKGSLHFTEITYAKARGLLDDDATFRPGEALTVADAALWLLRTRNVADMDDLTRDNWTALLAKYPIVASGSGLQEPVSEEDLLALIRRFDTMLLEEQHEVSLYAEKFHGKGTAFGEAFDMHAMTAAHRTFPHNTLVKVTNVSNGKSVVVRINDRGPYVHGRDMDLSLAAFTAIENRSRGKFMATFQRLGDATMVGGCADNTARQRRIARGVTLTDGIPHTMRLGGSLTLSANAAFVVRGVRYPGVEGLKTMQDWVHPGETYEFRPSVVGDYVFQLGTTNGRKRQMTMKVVECQN